MAEYQSRTQERSFWSTEWGQETEFLFFCGCSDCYRLEGMFDKNSVREKINLGWK